jgi:PPOX class probable F420-dependent enzyme
VAQMTTEQRDAFLQQPRIATFISLNPDGSPTAVPVWYEWDGAVARIFTSRNSEKIRRITADPRVALTVAEPLGVTEAWVTIEGAATVTDGDSGLTQRLAPRYYSAEKAARVIPEWEKLASTWVTITITPTRIRSSAPT